MNSALNGFILAGGLNSRIGTDKALLLLKDKTVIEIIIEKLLSVCRKVSIISNHSELYKFHNVEVIKDIIPGKGPMSGIHAALYQSDTEMNFITSCDIPLISKKLLFFIASRKLSTDAVVPVSHTGIEPLCSIYSKTCFKPLDNILKSNLGDYTLYRFLKPLNVEYLNLKDEFSDYNNNLFLNLNTSQDYNIISEIYKNSL